MAKSDRIVIRLEADMRAKVHAKSSALGLDDAAYVRMLVYRDFNGQGATEPGVVNRGAAFEAPMPRAGSAPRQVERPFSRPGSSAAAESAAAELDEPPLEEIVPADEPRAEDMDIPADADDGPPAQLEELLATAPSVLDELLAAAEQPPHPMIVELARPARVPQRGYRAPLSNRDRGLVAFGGPGSRTRPIGVNDGIVGANNYGDGPGNVLRDNMRHFGFGGTRSR